MLFAFESGESHKLRLLVIFLNIGKFRETAKHSSIIMMLTVMLKFITNVVIILLFVFCCSCGSWGQTRYRGSR